MGFYLLPTLPFSEDAQKNTPSMIGFFKGKFYFITWLVQNVTGQVLLLSSSEVGQHLTKANINGALEHRRRVSSFL